MIKSFKNKTTQDFYQGKRVKQWQAFQKQVESEGCKFLMKQLAWMI